MPKKSVYKNITNEQLALMINQGFRDMNQRFEQVDQRFIGIDQRFEQMDRRFEQADKRFNDFVLMVKQGFDDTPTRAEMNERFDLINIRFNGVEKRLDKLDKDWVVIQKVKNSLAID